MAMGMETGRDGNQYRYYPVFIQELFIQKIYDSSMVQGKLIINLLVLAVLAVWSQDSFALRCDNRLVDKGDSVIRLQRYCPEPFWVESWEVPRISHHGYREHYDVDRFEAWYINLGPRKLMRRLVIRNGFLVSEQTLDHGFSYPRKCSAQQLESAGDSLAEVYARCGPPDYQDAYVTEVRPRHRNARGFFHSGPTVYVSHERWTYDFGRRTQLRILEFQDGRLIRINRERP